MHNIFKYFAVLGSFIFLFNVGVFAQEDEEETEARISLFQGVMIEVDVFSAVMSAVNRETYSFEANMRINLGERYFPVVEVGFAGANKISIHDYGFRTDGFFARIGLDYNMLQPNTETTSIRRYFFIGGRYGFSPFSYDVTNVLINNEFWGENAIRNFYGETTTKHWFEAVAGLRVEVLNNIYMGWSARLRMQLNRNRIGEISPWFIPGIGIQNAGNWGFQYTIGYKF